jgi:flavin-dependent dehydrogenase
MLNSQTNVSDKVFDVLVVGGGPAGTTVASCLVEKGWSVCLLEKAIHPRFHIGESLLPRNMPILQQLGVLDQVAAIGMPKYAAEFNSQVAAARQDSFYFAQAADKTFTYAFEVRRSEFDEILFRNATAKGVHTLEDVTVKGVEFSDHVHTVRAFSSSGELQEYQCRFFVDASGRDTFLANRFNLKQKNPKHQMAAMFGHFHQVERRKGLDEGNISIYWFEHGWIWLIPLKDGMMSVGCVCWPEYLKSRQKRPLNSFLIETINKVPKVAERMERAELAGDAQATGNYSYSAQAIAGTGYLLIGDAYAFVDPVFSSGVYLAMNSAVKGADYIDKVLQQPQQEKRLIAEYEKAIQKEIKAFCWFIYRFNSPVLHKLLMSSETSRKNSFKQRMKSAVISVLAGDSANQQIQLPLNLFKGLYYLMVLFDFKGHWTFLRFREKQNKVVFDEV